MATMLPGGSPSSCNLLDRALIGNFSSPMSGPHNISAVNNDTLSSFQNQTPYSVAFWHDSNGTGWCFSGSTARADATTAARHSLTNHNLGCGSTSVTVDTSAFAAPIGTPGPVCAT